MGCTPKGLSIPRSVQYSPFSSDTSFSSYSQPAVSYTPPPVKQETYAAVTPTYDTQPSTKTSYKPCAETQERLQSCHCGWSKVTSYQGLRIHQGKMGCTPKGLGIPEDLQYLFTSSASKYEATPTKPREKTHGVNDASSKCKPQPSTKTKADTKVEELRKIQHNPLNRSVQKEKPSITRPKPKLTPDTTEALVKKENKSCFETPQQDRPSTRDAAKSRRALDFSSTAMQVKKDRIKAQIESRLQKTSEIRASLETGEACLDEEWKEINNVCEEVIQIVKEARDRELKSLAIRKESLKRDANTLITKIEDDIKKLMDTLFDVEFGADVDMVLLKMKSKDYSLNTPFDFGTLQMNISTMMEQIQQELDQLSARDLKRVAPFAALSLH